MDFKRVVLATVSQTSRRGETGRRARLKIWYPQGCVGSNPSAGKWLCFQFESREDFFKSFLKCEERPH